MSDALYEVLAVGMRYWFTFLGLLIVLRAVFWLQSDLRKRKKSLRNLPDAGTIGELVVVKGNKEMPQNAVIPVPWEGVLGFTRTCDVVIPVQGVAHRHLDFTFEEGKGLLITPRYRQICVIDGELCTKRHSGKSLPVLHGSTLEIGDAVLRLSLFAGIDAPHFAMFAPEDSAPYSPEQMGEHTEWPNPDDLFNSPDLVSDTRYSTPQPSNTYNPHFQEDGTWQSTSSPYDLGELAGPPMTETPQNIWWPPMNEQNSSVEIQQDFSAEQDESIQPRRRRGRRHGNG